MPSFSKNEVILVRYPFSDLAAAKIRPAVVVGAAHPSEDYFIVPLTSKISRLRADEFALSDWQAAGLNVPSAVKHGIYTVHNSLNPPIGGAPVGQGRAARGTIPSSMAGPFLSIQCRAIRL